MKDPTLSEYLSMAWAEFDSVVYALQHMAPNTRREAVIASCDEKDLRVIAELAAYMLGPEIWKSSRRRFGSGLGRALSMNRRQDPLIDAKPRIGRLQLRIRRAFIASDGEPLTIADFLTAVTREPGHTRAGSTAR